MVPLHTFSNTAHRNDFFPKHLLLVPPTETRSLSPRRDSPDTAHRTRLRRGPRHRRHLSPFLRALSLPFPALHLHKAFYLFWESCQNVHAGHSRIATLFAFSRIVDTER